MLLLVVDFRQEIFMAGSDLTPGGWNHLEVSSLTRGATVLLVRETSAEAVSRSPTEDSATLQASSGFLQSSPGLWAGIQEKQVEIKWPFLTQPQRPVLLHSNSYKQAMAGRDICHSFSGRE